MDHVAQDIPEGPTCISSDKGYTQSEGSPHPERDGSIPIGMSKELCKHCLLPRL